MMGILLKYEINTIVCLPYIKYNPKNRNSIIFWARLGNILPYIIIDLGGKTYNCEVWVANKYIVIIDMA